MVGVVAMEWSAFITRSMYRLVDPMVGTVGKVETSILLRIKVLVL